MKKRFIVASALALSVTLGGATFLTGNVQAATVVQPTKTQNVAAQGSASGNVKGKGFEWRGFRGNQGRLDQAAIATLLGITETDLKTAERDGKSLAVIAGEKGVAVQSVVDLVTKELTTALDKQLADGKITQAQYNTKKAEISTKASELVNRTFTAKGDHENHGKLDQAAIATLLGLSETDLKTALHGGKSLAAIAGEKGVSVQAVVDLLSKQFTTALDKRLADGKITQAQYDKEKATITVKVTEIANRTHTDKDGHGKFDHNRG
ncbi:SHOCT domain-containing protein [Paenibacillus sp. NPDC058177]|uniref:SHOCT domain-containing protein n=1 Tax=Paenibacillus sp. NPDC058177 TaxID=3346369 RepID=UPI0036D8300E